VSTLSTRYYYSQDAGDSKATIAWFNPYSSSFASSRSDLEGVDINAGNADFELMGVQVIQKLSDPIL
jgi:hypothetical protein